VKAEDERGRKGAKANPRDPTIPNKALGTRHKLLPSQQLI
jgi:hypothetical protein